MVAGLFKIVKLPELLKIPTPRWGNYLLPRHLPGAEVFEYVMPGSRRETGPQAVLKCCRRAVFMNLQPAGRALPGALVMQGEPRRET
jgi:hypothetical protein